MPAVETNVGEPDSVSEESLPTSDFHVAAQESLPKPAELPREFGRYTLTQLLGRGGFAHVYQTFDSELGRDIALKIPRRDRFSTRQQLLQFLEEARVCAKLEHPGIVRIYDVGWLTDDLCYIAMELCPRGSMDVVVKPTERVPPQRAAELVADLADAIHRAHVAGVVHRDLKPSNILFGADGRPRIADFGLAMPEERLLDCPGEVVGTLPYMSPEQVRGESHLLDGRSDIWSLGVILYQLLTGRRPFLGELQQLREQILKRDPKPLRQVVDEIPVELEQICLRCLHKTTSERWATAKDLAQQLRNWLDSSRSQSSVATAGPPPAPAPDRRGRWRTVAVRSAMVTGLVCGLALLAVARKDQGANRSLDQAVPYRQYELLVNAPQKLVWPLAGEAASVDHSATEAKLNLTSRELTLVELADTRAANFDLAVTVYRTARTGSSGVFWGYHPDPEHEADFHCHAAFFVTTQPRLGHAIKSKVIVSRLKFHRAQNGELGLIEQEDLASEPVEPLTDQGGQLTVRICAAGVRDVKWNGRSLTQIRSALAQDESFSRPNQPPYRPQGAFGLLNRLGNSLYRNATFTLNKGTAS